MRSSLPVLCVVLLAACSEPRADRASATTRADTPRGSALASTRPADQAATDLPDFGDPRLFLSIDSLRWSQWETRVDGDREARLRALGIRPLRTDSTGPREPVDPEYVDEYDPYGERAADFHFIDFSGDGVDDVIYDGAWFMQGESEVGAGEGTRIKLYQVMGGRAVQVMAHHASIQRIFRGAAGQPLSFRAVHYGCCADPEWTVEYYRPVRAGDTVRFEAYHRVGGRQELVMPARFLTAPRRFVVNNDPYQLRDAPTIQPPGPGGEEWFDWEGHGNALAEYGRGARGIALAEQTDATGRVWWFVRMDGGTPPRDAHISEGVDEHDHPLPMDRLGWMSSRFLTPEP